MPRRYVVQAGDHLLAITAREGFEDSASILEHPDNADQRRRRNPAILDPGEDLTLPDLKPKQVSLTTGRVHKIVVSRPKAKLKVVVRTFRGGESKAEEVHLALGEGPTEAVSLVAGTLEKPLPHPLCDRASMTMKATGKHPELRWRLRLGHLGRIESDEGALARLRNLGYLRRVSDEAQSRERRSAIEEFQADHGLMLSGELDDDTRTKLEEIYGC
jgi:hypothetical protein